MTQRSPSCCEHTPSLTEALINLNRSTTSCWSAIVPYFTLPGFLGNSCLCAGEAIKKKKKKEKEGCLGAEPHGHRGMFVREGGWTQSGRSVCSSARRGAAETQQTAGFYLRQLKKTSCKTFHKCSLVDFFLGKMKMNSRGKQLQSFWV